MSRDRLAFVIIVVFLPCVVTGLVSSPSNRSAEDIVKRHIAAIGGRSHLDRIQSIQSVGILNEHGTLHPIYMDRRRPDLLRVRMIHGGDLVFTEVYDGSSSWEGAPGKEQCSPDSAARAATRQAAQQFDDPLIAAAPRARVMKLVGVEQIAGRSLYRIDIQQEDGSEGSYYVDAETFMLDRERSQRALHPGQPMRTIELVLGDYRPVSGVLYPFRSLERDVETGEPLTAWLTFWTDANVPIAGNPYARPTSCH